MVIILMRRVRGVINGLQYIKENLIVEFLDVLILYRHMPQNVSVMSIPATGAVNRFKCGG